MAIYHLSCTAFTRAQGDNSVAKSAYRACRKMTCKRTGATYDYTRKRGNIYHQMMFPSSVKLYEDAELFWNDVEKKERRKNSCVAREFEISLPHELPTQTNIKLAQDFTKWLTERHQCAAQIDIHTPVEGRNDTRNIHAHILFSTRNLLTGEKVRAYNREHGASEINEARKEWERLLNEALTNAGEARVSRLRGPVKSHETIIQELQVQEAQIDEEIAELEATKQTLTVTTHKPTEQKKMSYERETLSTDILHKALNHRKHNDVNHYDEVDTDRAIALSLHKNYGASPNQIATYIIDHSARADFRTLSAQGRKKYALEIAEEITGEVFDECETNPLTATQKPKLSAFSSPARPKPMTSKETKNAKQNQQHTDTQHSDRTLSSAANPTATPR